MASFFYFWTFYIGLANLVLIHQNDFCRFISKVKLRIFHVSLTTKVSILAPFKVDKGWLTISAKPSLAVTKASNFFIILANNSHGQLENDEISCNFIKLSLKTRR